MNIKKLTVVAMLALGLSANAANERTTIAQVTDGVTLTSNVDYVITDATPFATSGSVDIQNTEHAALIIYKVKPSVVLKKWMKNILINGEPAVDGVNCQVRMYNRGSIILPYAQDFRPLTCFTESDFSGESCDNYSEGSNGGFMKTLAASTLDNKIKSFKLKRGYMVTFALGKSGWGYSRCFIADTEDLEMNLPTHMSGKVSSYRLFKWWDASKAGIHDTSAGTNNALNTTSCFDWAQGNASLLPDVEWVPNHIYEDWPSAATCGSVTGSCHMKTNNEPGNSADDHPQDVETVLNNWQNLMRTGMRLCSESSHDGSMGHLKTFIEEIDKRGWRCDILDLHCYWTGQFWNLDWYRSEYGKGRPIWISEWVYGSSWGNAGIFKDCPDGRNSFSKANQQKNYDFVKPVLDILNSKDYIERYFYWNSEADCSKIYKDGQNSILGKYYAEMETGLAYNKKNEYIPKVVYTEPTNLTGTYSKAKGTFVLNWEDTNGDMVDSVVVECKPDGAARFTWLANVPVKDLNGKTCNYTYTAYPEAGANYYRVAVYPAGSKTAKYSDEVSVSISSAKGTNEFQYGKLTVTNTDVITTDFSDSFEEMPAVFMGLYSNKNTTLYPGNLLTKVTTTKFSYQTLPLKNQKSATTTVDKAEEVPFLALKEASGTFGKVPYEVGIVKAKSDETEFKFATPFPDGVKPVIITEVRNPIQKTDAIIPRVWDVTNEGFKACVNYEAALNKKINIQLDLCYLAVAPGEGTMFSDINSSELVQTDTISVDSVVVSETEDMITKEVTIQLRNTYKNTVGNLDIAAGISADALYGTTARSVYFTDADGSYKYFNNPIFFGALQTRNYQGVTILRRTLDTKETDEASEYYQMMYGSRIKRMVDTSSSEANSKDNGDTFGWIILTNSNTVEEEYKNETVYETVEMPREKSEEEVSIMKYSVTNSSSRDLQPKVNNGVITLPGITDFEVFTASGAKLSKTNRLVPGIYVVKANNKTAKVIVK